MVRFTELIDAHGYCCAPELRLTFTDTYYPDRVADAELAICRYTNDDLKRNDRETHRDEV